MTTNPTVNYGARGDLVTTLQALLNMAGANPRLTTDGLFGDATLKAVRQFQRDHHLTDNGVVDADTWLALSKLNAATSSSTPTPAGAGAAPSCPFSAAASGAVLPLLGLAEASPGADLLGQLASVVGAERRDVSVNVTPGDVDSILKGLQSLQAGGEAAERLDALIFLYQSQASLPPEQRASAQRLAVLSIAATQIGTVRAHEAAADPTNPSDLHARIGWQRLNEYFKTAFGPGGYEEKTVHDLQGTLSSWCGIFALWAHKTAGIQAGMWHIGDGISAVKGFHALGHGEPLRPGDIGIIDPRLGHHFLVVSADAETIASFDGNEHDSQGHFGCIVHTHHPRAKVLGFYRAVELD